MTYDRIKEAADRYRVTLLNEGFDPKRNEKGAYACGDDELFGHVLWMCEEIYKGEMGIEKAFRWLGFVQGVLYAKNIFSISEMKQHNKPE